MTESNLPQSNSSNPPSRNEVYYLEPVIFQVRVRGRVHNIPRQNTTTQVEDQLFKVPRYHFVHYSEVFEATFSLPQAAGSDPEGSTDNAPIRLEAVNKGDFQTLLEVMYPL
jgi:hypothetical protein